MKKVLITGANSYIGVSFEKYANDKYPQEFFIETLDMIDDGWRSKDFSPYDIVYHVAGIAHHDVGNASDEVKAKYYSVNTDLAIETAMKAKEAGVKQFVFMSSAIVYGDSAPYGKDKIITWETGFNPTCFYGNSKVLADQKIRDLEDSDFSVCVLRPPMVYGKGCKGKYIALSKMAKTLPIFPNLDNKRSMIYIENLCEFLCQVMIRNECGVFFPQNVEYIRTSEMVRIIAEVNNHRIDISKKWNWIVKLAVRIPGKVSKLANKAFGNFIYDQSISEYEFEYRIVDLKESIRRTENCSIHTM